MKTYTYKKTIRCMKTAMCKIKISADPFDLDTHRHCLENYATDTEIIVLKTKIPLHIDLLSCAMFLLTIFPSYILTKMKRHGDTII